METEEASSSGVGISALIQIIRTNTNVAEISNYRLGL